MEELAKENINVTLVNISTLKPIDREIILEQTKSHGSVVTAEDHNIIGGLGDAIARAPRAGRAREAVVQVLAAREVRVRAGRAQQRRLAQQRVPVVPHVLRGSFCD